MVMWLKLCIYWSSRCHRCHFHHHMLLQLFKVIFCGSGLWDVNSLQTLCWEICDKSWSWDNVATMLCCHSVCVWAVTVVCQMSPVEGLLCQWQTWLVVGALSGCVVECQICNREVAGLNLSLGYFAPRSTQPSIPPGSVNEYRLRLGK